MTQPFSALVWDCDGTLIDTTSLIVHSLDSIYQAFFGRTLPEPELRALIGTPLRTQIRIFGEPAALGVDEDEITRSFIGYYEAHRADERVLHAVTAILAFGHRAGFPTALVTSKNREELANTLPRLGIEPYLDAVVTADDVMNPKPAPDGLLLAASLLGLPAGDEARAVYIGDTVHDMEAAVAAGFMPVAVGWGAASPAALAQGGARHVCDTPAALAAILGVSL